MGLEEKNIPEEDVQILSVNEEKIKKDKDNLSEVKSSKKNIYLKKTAKNIAKLTLLAVTSLLEVPVVKSFVGAVGAMEANRIMGLISKLIGEISNMPLTNIGGQLVQMELYANMSLPNGQYSWVGYLINFCIQLAVDHPAKVIAGGAVLAGLLTNALIYPTIKKIVRMAKGAYYKANGKHNDNNTQSNLYDEVKKNNDQTSRKKKR